MSTRIHLACFLFLFSSVSQGATYSWSNAQGVKQYSDSCPVGVKCNVVRGGTATTRSGATSTKTSGTTSTTPLWSAGMETGNLSQWYSPCTTETHCGGSGGGEYNGAAGNIGAGGNPVDGDSVASRDRAHSGSWSIKQTISGTAVSGTRLFRWNEPVNNRELYYSVWYFVPQRYKVEQSGWNNWFQYKSATTDGKNDPFFILDARSRQSSGSMYFQLTWWPGLKIEGPARGQTGGRTWPSSKDIPVGRWFHVEARYICAGDFTGAIQVWQDGVQIFRLGGVKTRYLNGNCQWSVNNYGEKITPSPVVHYVDDVAISKTRIGR